MLALAACRGGCNTCCPLKAFDFCICPPSVKYFAVHALCFKKSDTTLLTKLHMLREPRVAVC